VPRPGDQHPIGDLSPCGAYPAFGIGIRPRAARRVFTASIPRQRAPRRMPRELADPVLITNWNLLARSPGSVSRFRADCTVQAPSGWAVTPRTWTWRLLTSSMKNTDRRRRETAQSTVNKSHASAWRPGCAGTAAKSCGRAAARTGSTGPSVPAAPWTPRPGSRGRAARPGSVAVRYAGWKQLAALRDPQVDTLALRLRECCGHHEPGDATRPPPCHARAPAGTSRVTLVGEAASALSGN
jgi:hypothetical protein